MQITVNPGGIELDGDLDIPPAASGLVVFAHGSGSSRRSPRNRHVAEVLHAGGFGTLLFDLLTASEESRDAVDASLRFDINLLAERLTAVVEEIHGRSETRHLPIGLFGASTGAAAALRAAANSPDTVLSVVSRGGRPDLAGHSLSAVRAPTLLLVGGDDHQVITLNQQAADQLTAEHELSIVPGASHLFEEPGTLDEAARRAVDWVTRTLPPANG